MKPELQAAILVHDLKELARKTSLVRRHVKTLHLDVMDGKFVDNKTYNQLGKMKRYLKGFHLSVHLMVANPEKYIADCLKLGAKEIIVHLEAVKSLKKLQNLVLKTKKAKLGLAINPETTVAMLAPAISSVDSVLVMAIKPGIDGQTMQRDTLRKIFEIKKLNSKVRVGVDGGVKLENAADCLEKGADFLVVGTGIFNSLSVPFTIKQFKRILAAQR